VFGCKALRKIFRPKWKLEETRENYIMRSFMVFIPHHMDKWQALLKAVISLQIS